MCNTLTLHDSDITATYMHTANLLWAHTHMQTLPCCMILTCIVHHPLACVFLYCIDTVYIPEVWNWCGHEWSVQINSGGENYHGIIHAILCKHFENIIMDTDSWTFFSPSIACFKFCPSTFCTHHAVSQWCATNFRTFSYDVTTFSWRVATLHDSVLERGSLGRG